jgi:hypothetical protein
VSYGLLNLTHRSGHAHPEPLEPGRRYEVRLQLNGMAQHFPPGHRLRLSLSTSYWPLAWPPPRPVRLTVFPAQSMLELPVRPAGRDDRALRTFLPPEGARPLTRRYIRQPRHDWIVQRNLATDESALEVTQDDGRYVIEEIDLEVESRTVERYSSCGDDFTSPRGEVTSVRRFRRDPWRTRVDTHTLLTATPSAFRVRAELDAYEGDSRIHSESWDETIERDLV